MIRNQLANTAMTKQIIKKVSVFFCDNLLIKLTKNANNADTMKKPKPEQAGSTSNKPPAVDKR